MITICTLFSTLTTKHRVYVKVASKQISDLKNSTAPPGFEIPGSATASRDAKIWHIDGRQMHGCFEGNGHAISLHACMQYICKVLYCLNTIIMRMKIIDQLSLSCSLSLSLFRPR